MITRLVFGSLTVLAIMLVWVQDIYLLREIGGFICYYDNTVPNNLSFVCASDPKTKEAVRNIMSFTSLPANFRIIAADVANSQAVIKEEKKWEL